MTFQVLIAFAVASAAAALILVVLMMVRSDLKGPSDEGFSLYKNSRFRDCAARTAEGFNCTDAMIRSGLIRDRGEGMLRYGHLESYMGKDEAENRQWCDLVGCLGDYQVVPSVPAPDATSSSILFIWYDVAMIAFLIFNFLKGQYDFEFHLKEDCTERGVMLWAGAVTSIISMLWWWVDVFRMIGSPHIAHSLSPLNWITTWRTAHAFHWHPIACYFHDKRKLHKIIWWGLLVVAAVQFGVSIFIFSQAAKVATTDILWYQFLEDDFLPGRGGLCSAADVHDASYIFQLAANGLGLEPDIPIVDSRDDVAEKLSIFVLLTLSTAPEVFAIIFLWCRSRRTPEGLVGSKTLMRILNFFNVALASVALALITARGLRTSIIFLQSANREAGFAIDHDCMTVHVGTSVWRQNLDIESGPEPVRIIRGLLNVGL